MEDTRKAMAAPMSASRVTAAESLLSLAGRKRRTEEQPQTSAGVWSDGVRVVTTSSRLPVPRLPVAGGQRRLAMASSSPLAVASATAVTASSGWQSRRTMVAALYGLLLVTLLSAWSPSVVWLADAKDIKAVSTSLDMQCPPCERIHCSPRRANRLRCRGGVTRGVCDCCPVCAKTEGERCGGSFNYLGKCDAGLYCAVELPPPKNDLRLYRDTLQSTRQKPRNSETGVCQLVPTKHSHLGQGDQPVSAPDACREKCTPELCVKSPRKLCSAIDNAEKQQTCQGQCQHTSCSACRFLTTEPECEKCDRDDVTCLKHFGRCIKRASCSRAKHPCKSDMMQTGAKFQCLVPECRAP